MAEEVLENGEKGKRKNSVCGASVKLDKSKLSSSERYIRIEENLRKKGCVKNKLSPKGMRTAFVVCGYLQERELKERNLPLCASKYRDAFFSANQSDKLN
ncbi:hypothetical protein Trydic_g6597 [Trypoxylus dichotomus]